MRRELLRPALALALVSAVGLIAVSLDAALSTLPKIEVIASGLDNPRGLTIGPDQAVYVAEAGRGGGGACLINGENRQVCYGPTGAITRIGHLLTTRVVKGLPSLAPAPGQPGEGGGASGVQDILFDRFGRGTATIGLGANPELRESLGPAGRRFARVIKFTLWGAVDYDQDLGTYEVTEDPGGDGPDSNPFGLAQWDGDLVVADAGGNDIVRIDNGGLSTLAVFPPKMVPFGPPGNLIPMQAVPTTVAAGPDGALYVGQLTGFPFPAGGASVFRIAPGGQPEEYATGFTNIIDIAFGRDGSLYVLQISANGLLTGNPAGKLTRVARNGTRTEIAAGALIAPGGLAIARDGSIYVSRFTNLAGAGDVVKIEP